MIQIYRVSDEIALENWQQLIKLTKKIKSSTDGGISEQYAYCGQYWGNLRWIIIVVRYVTLELYVWSDTIKSNKNNLQIFWHRITISAAELSTVVQIYYLPPNFSQFKHKIMIFLKIQSYYCSNVCIKIFIMH